MALLFWLWAFVNFWLLREGPFAADRYVVYTIVLLGGLGIDFLRAGGTSQTLLDVGRSRYRVISARQAAIAVATLLLFLFAGHDQVLSRFFLFTFLPLLFVLLLVTNKAVPPVLANFIFRNRRLQRTVVVGSVGCAARLDGWLKDRVRYGLQAVGLVTNDPPDQVELSLPILGTEDELEKILVENNASQLLVAGLPPSGSIQRLGELCDRLGLHLLIMNDLEERIGRAVSFVQDGGFRFLSLRDEPLECPFNRMMKRCVDIALALPVVVLVLPFTSLVVYVCHRLQSQGPLIFKQLRTGIYGDEFLIYKYRTMHVAAFDEAQQATVNDPRVFRAGSWLRKLSIDELPQFINVLKGDMSIVGPRPHLQKHDAIFSSIAHSYRVRAFIRPGITGLAQVSGYRGEARRSEEVVSRVTSDLFYLENWSLYLDTAIIFKTALQMIFPPREAV